MEGLLGNSTLVVWSAFVLSGALIYIVSTWLGSVVELGLGLIREKSGKHSRKQQAVMYAKPSQTSTYKVKTANANYTPEFNSLPDFTE